VDAQQGKIGDKMKEGIKESNLASILESLDLGRRPEENTKIS
jgi:hypothetical protein